MIIDIEKEIIRRYGEIEAKDTIYLIKEIFYILSFFSDVLKNLRNYKEMEYRVYSDQLVSKIHKLKVICEEMDEKVEKGLQLTNLID